MINFELYLSSCFQTITLQNHMFSSYFNAAIFQYCHRAQKIIKIKNAGLHNLKSSYIYNSDSLVCLDSNSATKHLKGHKSQNFY